MRRGSGSQRVEAVLRKSPLPLREPGPIAIPDMLLHALAFQRQTAATAQEANRLRTQSQNADAVGPGRSPT